MDENQFRILLQTLSGIKLTLAELTEAIEEAVDSFQRMAKAAEEQVKESKAMRLLVLGRRARAEN